MADTAFLSVLAFLLLKVALTVLTLWHGYVTARRLAAHVRRGNGSIVGRCERALRANAFRSAASLFLVVAVGYSLTAEGPYRPKTQVEAPAGESEPRQTPAFVPAAPKPTWDEVQRKNAEENEKSRQEFEKLPAE